MFRSVAEWGTFWIENHENRYQQLPTPPVPAVDFGGRMLVGVFWGPQGGCATNATPVQVVEHVDRTGESLTVEVGPLGDLGVCRAVSWPVQIVEVPRVEGEVSFSGRVPT
ncbi:MAG TPA: hypothetical protein VF576_07950, partial [Rubricoccaceae bacterium]